jgi:hypothetical protein
MESLAKAFDRKALAAEAFSLYEKFRPTIPGDKRGWGATGELDLSLILSWFGGCYRVSVNNPKPIAPGIAERGEDPERQCAARHSRDIRGLRWRGQTGNVKTWVM